MLMISTTFLSKKNIMPTNYDNIMFESIKYKYNFLQNSSGNVFFPYPKMMAWWCRGNVFFSYPKMMAWWCAWIENYGNLHFSFKLWEQAHGRDFRGPPFRLKLEISSFSQIFSSPPPTNFLVHVLLPHIYSYLTFKHYIKLSITTCPLFLPTIE